MSKSDFDKAFELAAQWGPSDRWKKTLRGIRKCLDCRQQILPGENGYRCGCSQWRFMNDPDNQKKTIAERRKLSE